MKKFLLLFGVLLQLEQTTRFQNTSHFVFIFYIVLKLLVLDNVLMKINTTI